MPRVEFRAERVELVREPAGRTVLSVHGCWSSDAIRQVGRPDLVVEIGGARARTPPLPFDGSGAALAGPLPEPWSAIYEIDPALLAGASLSLETADGERHALPPAEPPGAKPANGGHRVEELAGVAAATTSEPAATPATPSPLEAVYRARSPEPASAPFGRVPEQEPISGRGQAVHAGPILEASDVAKSYGDVVALDGVDIDIEPGEILGLLGANGAGKTTLISIVAGLLPPDRGEVKIAGLDARADPLDVHRMIGVAPQELAVYLTLTVRRNLAFAGEMNGLEGVALDERVDEVADVLELTEMLDRPVQKLSGGEKRRVHTGMAMVHRPALLLLDEPTAGIDVTARSRFLDTVKLLASEGAAVCYTTHYLQEVEALDASVAILEAGRIVARGPVRELVAASGRAMVEVRFRDSVPAELRRLGTVEEQGALLRIE